MCSLPAWVVFSDHQSVVSITEQWPRDKQQWLQLMVWLNAIFGGMLTMITGVLLVDYLHREWQVNVAYNPICQKIIIL